MADGAGRVGFGYTYHLWFDYDMLSQEHGYKLKPGDHNFIFEIRTNFIFKKITQIQYSEDEDEDEDEDEGEILDSEKFGVCFSDNNNGPLPLHSFISDRLEDYWMTSDEISALARKAVYLARRVKAAARSELPNLVFPVIIGINIFTVQQEWETVDAARERAIRSKHLVPVYLTWELACFRMDVIPRPVRLMSFLRGLPRIRVVNNAVDDDDDESNKFCVLGLFEETVVWSSENEPSLLRNHFSFPLCCSVARTQQIS